MTIIVKNVYTEKQYEVKGMASYKEVEDYVFTNKTSCVLYNAVYNIEQETATFYVYGK